MGIDVSFGNNLKILRKEHNLTQQMLADNVGIARSTIVNYERGNRQPTTFILESFSRYFGVTNDYLLGNKNNSTLENAFIGDETGLSTEAIEILNFYKTNFPDEIISTVNLLIEQLGPVSKDYLSGAGQDCPEKGPALASLSIVEIVEQYLNINLNVDDDFLVSEDGHFENIVTFVNDGSKAYENVFRSTKLKRINSEKLFKMYFLNDINESLQELKKQKDTIG